MQKHETLLKHQTEEWKNCNRMADIMTAAYEICESKCDKSRKKLYNVVKNTILYFEPDFFDYVNQVKVCDRELRYIGDKDDEFKQKMEHLLKHNAEEEWKNVERSIEIMTAAHEICESKCDKSRKKLRNVVKNTILYFEPDFFDYVNQVKVCDRKLRYIGDSDDFFTTGEIYESIDYNGATYSIKGYNNRIGCGHFERIT